MNAVPKDQDLFSLSVGQIFWATCKWEMKENRICHAFVTPIIDSVKVWVRLVYIAYHSQLECPLFK